MKGKLNLFPSLEKLGEKRGKPPVLENMGGAKSGGVNTVGVPPTDPQLFKTGEATPPFFRSLVLKRWGSDGETPSVVLKSWRSDGGTPSVKSPPLFAKTPPLFAKTPPLSAFPFPLLLSTPPN